MNLFKKSKIENRIAHIEDALFKSKQEEEPRNLFSIVFGSPQSIEARLDDIDKRMAELNKSITLIHKHLGVDVRHDSARTYLSKKSENKKK